MSHVGSMSDERLPVDVVTLLVNIDRSNSFFEHRVFPSFFTLPWSESDLYTCMEKFDMENQVKNTPFTLTLLRCSDPSHPL